MATQTKQGLLPGVQGRKRPWRAAPEIASSPWFPAQPKPLCMSTITTILKGSSSPRRASQPKGKIRVYRPAQPTKNSKMYQEYKYPVQHTRCIRITSIRVPLQQSVSGGIKLQRPEACSSKPRGGAPVTSVTLQAASAALPAAAVPHAELRPAIGRPLRKAAKHSEAQHLNALDK